MKHKKMTFQIPDFLYNEFANYCKDNGLNKAAISRGLIYLYLKERIQDPASPIFEVIEQ